MIGYVGRLLPGPSPRGELQPLSPDERARLGDVFRARAPDHRPGHHVAEPEIERPGKPIGADGVRQDHLAGDRLRERRLPRLSVPAVARPGEVARPSAPSIPGFQVTSQEIPIQVPVSKRLITVPRGRSFLGDADHGRFKRAG